MDGEALEDLNDFTTVELLDEVYARISDLDGPFYGLPAFVWTHAINAAHEIADTIQSEMTRSGND